MLFTPSRIGTPCDILKIFEVNHAYMYVSRLLYYVLTMVDHSGIPWYSPQTGILANPSLLMFPSGILLLVILSYL